MNYQVIARKFRPQVFEDVVGQKPIVQTLKNAIQLGRVGHAYLFSGPRGVGKTTTARILAKGLNCLQGPTTTPCNECDSCKEVSAGRSIDVLEIDAASNTGVDSIRELRENARYAPSRDRYKIFIIDEVHMLSTSAFNALLKILEEPPPHVIFIMATTERHKLPATILSRCQQFAFRTIPSNEIFTHLREIATREDVAIDDVSLDYIVKAAEGSMRDAQSLLEQIIAFSEKDILEEDVRDVLGFVPSDIIDRTIDGLAERDSKKLLDLVGIVVEQGFNLQQHVRQLVGRLRDLLLVKLDLENQVLGTAEEKQGFRALSERFSEQDLIRFFDMLLRIENDLRWTSQSRFHLEVGLVKMAKVGRLRDIEEVIRDLRNPGEYQNTAGPPRTTTRPTPTQKTAHQPALKTADADDRPPNRQAETALDRYKQLVEQKSMTTFIYLQKADEVQVAGEKIEITCSNETVRALLQMPEHLTVLNQAASELVGKPISVSFIMVERISTGQGSPIEPENLRQTAEKEPLVRSFIDVFRGDLQQVKPARNSEPENATEGASQ